MIGGNFVKENKIIDIQRERILLKKDAPPLPLEKEKQELTGMSCPIQCLNELFTHENLIAIP